MLAAAFLALGLMSWIAGLLTGLLSRKSLLAGPLISLAAVAAILALARWVFRRRDELAKERADFLRGAQGEISVGYKLSSFPEGFYVINDLKTESGNLDHVVIGLTGVFALDTKNWRGIVAADGSGELLLNGRFEKAHITPSGALETRPRYRPPRWGLVRPQGTLVL